MSEQLNGANPPVYNQSYLTTGKGQAVILLHGLFGNLAMWKSTVDALKSTCKVVIPRLPVFDLPFQHNNLESQVNALHEFLTWNKLRDVILVGHAMGGQLALMYACHHPGNTQKVVLTGSAGFFENSAFMEENLSGLNDFEEVHAKAQEAFFKSEVPVGLVEDMYATIKNISKPTTLYSRTQSSHNRSVESLLNKLDHPVLLLWGLEDRITPPEVAFHFHDFLLNSEIRFINECGHVPMVDQPEKFNQSLVQFINK